MSQKTPEASINRAIELLAGAKPSQREAATAVGVSTSTLERALRDPRNKERARADDVNAATRAVVKGMFEATLPDGSPDTKTRERAAALRLRNADAFAKLEEDEPFGEDFFPGYVLVPQNAYGMDDAEYAEQYPWEYAKGKARDAWSAQYNLDHPPPDEDE